MKNTGSGNSRRNFLRVGMLGLTAAAFAPSTLRSAVGAAAASDAASGAAGAAEAAERPAKGALVYRTLGKTGLKVPIVSLGAGNVQETALIRAALDRGITLIDTARTYGRGNNETMIGEAVKGRPRDSFVIVTKSYNPAVDNRTGVFKSTTKGEFFLNDLDASLKALGLEFVDVFCVHDVVRGDSIRFDAVLKAFEQAKQSGKARFIGVSTHRGEPEVIRAMLETKIWDVVVTSYNFRQPHLAEVKAAVADAAKAGLGIIAMKTQAGVFWDRERKNMINMKAALKWALENENIHTTIPGPETLEQLEVDLSVMADLALTAEDRKDLKLGALGTPPGLYCAQCGLCVDQCRRNHDIPTMMRSYMYAYGYRRPAKAKETYASAGAGSDPCDGCLSCSVRCTMGFPVRERLTDIARIAAVPEEFLA